MNAAENEAYDDKDLEEIGGQGGGMNSQQLAGKMAELNRRLAEQPEDKPLKAAAKKIEKDYLARMGKYEDQERKRSGRNSYSKIDEDATCMRTKEGAV